MRTLGIWRRWTRSTSSRKDTSKLLKSPPLRRLHDRLRMSVGHLLCTCADQPF